ncbi:MAG: DEAD/DEAH box helicase family protein [Oscillospiraceae bacterium]|nr:DEAD/DEAH box helicase family protein [Oscillospiraceae bacterium]
MDYFKNQYCNLQYPHACTEPGLEQLGLRNAQIGAIHAVASHATLDNKASTVIVMPTGSGKTAVLMMAPYVLRKKKVLIVTPSAMVRGQIFNDYRNLKTLKKLGVFTIETPNPSAFEAMHEYPADAISQDEYDKNINNADVVVATHQVAATISESRIRDAFDYVMIDEAHHVQAPTWQRILINMNHAETLLVTATPFRLDRKEIKGDIVYNYPLSKAYKDGVFGEITYIPIEEAPNKDELIALEAERVFLNDKERGFEHCLMVRTDTKEKAKALEIIYQKNTGLKLKRIDSSMSYVTAQKAIEQMKNGKLDGIICVNMLGEGFDFPNMKIAAIHEPHKSLASTLQFIGRFARTNADNIGEAKFIAMNDSSLKIENCELYSADAIWQDIIVNLTETKINTDIKGIETLNHFSKPNLDDEGLLSLHNVRPNCHAKIFKIDNFRIDADFPEICNINNNVYRNKEDNTIVGIAYVRESPLWLEGNQISNLDIHLFIVHFQKETGLLFIYSQDKSEFMYQTIVDSFSGNYQKLQRNEMNRVLGELQNYEFFNTGMQNRYSEAGESYRIVAGSNTAASIDETTGKMVSAGHAFCKAQDGDRDITIGYSSGSKIWSSSYCSIPDYIAWCDENGKKIVNSTLVVKTGTNYDLLPIPKKNVKYPQNVMFCFLPEKSYISPPSISIKGHAEEHYLITDLDITLVAVDPELLSLQATINEISELIYCDLEGNYRSNDENLTVHDGRLQVSLPQYLTSHPLTFKTTDDTVIVGDELLTGDKAAIVFNPDHITAVDWISLGTNIHNECSKPSKEGKSIQTVLRDRLVGDGTFSHIIFDHGTGEIADFVTFSTNDTTNTVFVNLYHVKAMKGTKYNSSVNDVYEVSQQAIKSTIWIKDKNVLLNTINNRVKNSSNPLEKFVKGDLKSLSVLLRENRTMAVTIYIVQPSVSKKTSIPDKIGEVLASATHYIKHSGRAKELKILGSL